MKVTCNYCCNSRCIFHLCHWSSSHLQIFHTVWHNPEQSFLEKDINLWNIFSSLTLCLEYTFWAFQNSCITFDLIKNHVLFFLLLILQIKLLKIGWKFVLQNLWTDWAIILMELNETDQYALLHLISKASY